MQSFKQYLTEAKGKGVTRDEAKSLLKRIKSALRPDMIMHSVEQNGPDWDLMIRDSRYFTSRPGEEDDDWPDFTGEKDLLRKLNPILKGIEWTYSPEEKDWITISIKAKKLPAKALAKDAKKKFSSLMGQLVDEKEAAEDPKSRQFYSQLYINLKAGYKKKFITKDDFFAQAERTSWYDYDAAEEIWSMA